MVQIDRLFNEINPKLGEFTFDENVAHVFDDMISRSVPLYDDVQRVLPVLASLLDHPVIRVVDLGCSTGTSLIQLAQALPHRQLELIGVDNSQAMLDKCAEKLSSLDIQPQVELVRADIRDYEPRDASIILMNYTLQFVDLPSRPKLLSRICQSIRPDGFMLVSEKVSHHQVAVDDALVELYFEFKRRNGYSELEIARKREALETVLVPVTVDENGRMFREAGFAEVELLLKWFNFATFVVRKSAG
ncbi:MAG: carboxy-S-adenosyl-L-methionine synthase CmoA [Mariniblastus sp.]|nr:carboxy-S-adenosyl-L-methionine synthase CmoA [Mariniblastus sp.]